MISDSFSRGVTLLSIAVLVLSSCGGSTSTDVSSSGAGAAAPALVDRCGIEGTGAALSAVDPDDHVTVNGVSCAEIGGQFIPTGNMVDIHVGHTTTLLPDGRVLVACGIGGVFSPTVPLSVVPIAELFNPATGTFTSFPATPRDACTATLLPNGKVLLTGGADNGHVSDSAELFDPATGLFQPTGNMNSPREWHAATLLSDGKVLITGGSNNGSCLSTLGLGCAGVPPAGAALAAEIYDPATGTFTTTGSMLAARATHTATLLRNGRVLIAGGDQSGTAELYDPSSGAFLATGSMTTLRAGHTATLLTSGTVFIAGGGPVPNDSDYGVVMTAGTEIYDPVSGSFTSAGSMRIPRAGQTATLLNDGTVLLAGGATEDPLYACSTSGAEIYNPADSVFTAVPNMNQGRSAHSAVLLADGRVLITGGAHCQRGDPAPPPANTFPVNTAEIFYSY
jgi:large repetitive protein